MINRENANRVARFFFWRKLISKLLSTVFWRPRAKRVVNHIVTQIPEGTRVLDIGAGNGLIGEQLAAEKNADVTLLDVIDWNCSKLPLRMFDGKKIPFGDKEFDIALLCDVVHHSENEEELVKEALRVAHKVVVLEEKHEHKGISQLANISDNLQYILYGMPLGVHHRNSNEWLEFFQKFSAQAKMVGTYHQHVVIIIQ